MANSLMEVYTIFRFNIMKLMQAESIWVRLDLVKYVLSLALIEIKIRLEWILGGEDKNPYNVERVL